MARLHDVVIDCRHPASLARFWAQALDGYAVAPYDEEELTRLRAKGVLDPEDDPTVLVDGGLPRLWFQRVPERKVHKNRLHLDLRADDLDSEIDRLLGLGARLITTFDDWVVMIDPEGNEFCLA
ncbi:VOC family protein [Nonomuraea terrae]|uniref:VOC family protein n=1 Tax=Nonomuraea terrae TaxID=2530383 RepID=A0A4R4XSK8_9ACTN|nr:VOC family protein [Nonomuraea terrae]TDD34114.1 VOC family protein [Nonomuraea terrae]